MHSWQPGMLALSGVRHNSSGRAHSMVVHVLHAHSQCLGTSTCLCQQLPACSTTKAGSTHQGSCSMACSGRTCTCHTSSMQVLQQLQPRVIHRGSHIRVTHLRMAYMSRLTMRSSTGVPRMTRLPSNAHRSSMARRHDNLLGSMQRCRSTTARVCSTAMAVLKIACALQILGWLVQPSLAWVAHCTCHSRMQAPLWYLRLWYLRVVPAPLWYLMHTMPLPQATCNTLTRNRRVQSPNSMARQLNAVVMCRQGLQSSMHRQRMHSARDVYQLTRLTAELALLHRSVWLAPQCMCRHGSALVASSVSKRCGSRCMMTAQCSPHAAPGVLLAAHVQMHACRMSVTAEATHSQILFSRADTV